MTHDGLDTKAAAARLGVSYRTMQRYIEAYFEKGDRSKGFDVTKVHVAKGRGYEWRVHFGDDATADATPDTTPPPADVLVIRPVAVTTTPPPEDRELAVLALRALEDLRRERDALRAEVESLRRAHTDAHGPLRRLWARLGKGRGRA